MAKQWVDIRITVGFSVDSFTNYLPQMYMHRLHQLAFELRVFEWLDNSEADQPFTELAKV